MRSLEKGPCAGSLGKLGSIISISAWQINIQCEATLRQETSTSVWSEGPAVIAMRCQVLLKDGICHNIRLFGYALGKAAGERGGEKPAISMTPKAVRRLKGLRALAQESQRGKCILSQDLAELERTYL